MADRQRSGVELRTVAGDITTSQCQAIVNAANSSLLGGGGVDGAIHRAAGPDLLAQCREIVARQGGCAPGDAVITGAGALSARHVIHTVGPVWGTIEPRRADALLASCYQRSIELADAHDLTSVAFPNISTGVYHFPKDRAVHVAIAAIEAALGARKTDSRLERIDFVCFDRENEQLYRQALTPAG